MTTYGVSVDVDYIDAAERTSTIRYELRTEYDTTLNTGEGNMQDIVALVATLITALNVCTMADIEQHRISILIGDSGSANVAANNQVVAFSRFLDGGGYKSSITVPSWDDVTFDEDSQNLLSGAYDTAIAAVALLLRAPETDDDFALLPEYSQSRTRKSRNVIHD